MSSSSVPWGCIYDPKQPIGRLLIVFTRATLDATIQRNAQRRVVEIITVDVALILLLLASVALLLCADNATRLKYPVAPKGDQVDDYHGSKIADPYRGLENADAASTVGGRT